jgi:hypothetical protein
MASQAPRDDLGDEHIKVGKPMRSAAGAGGVVHGPAPGLSRMGVRRTALTLLKLNQVGGFDCPGCAWPDPAPPDRHHAEFCENGAKAVAEEATLRRVGPEFFAEHPIAELAEARTRAPTTRGCSARWSARSGAGPVSSA